MLVLIDISIVLQMCVEFAKLWFGRYTAKASTLMIVINSISLAVSLYVVGFSNIWNHTFVQDLGSLRIVGPDVLRGVDRFWNMFPTVLMVVMIIGYVIGTGTTIYRTWIAGRADT
jgi:hypothetical protein